MRRITIAVMGTVSALVALFSYHTSTNSGSDVAAVPAPSSTGDSSDVAPASGVAGDASSSTPSPSTSTSSSASSSGTYTGDTADTQWGIVQVQITVEDGRITASQAVQYPNGNGRDQEINAYALPQLNSEVVKAQNGSIDAISGATVTSDGYIRSLQSAIDQAHL